MVFKEYSITLNVVAAEKENIDEDLADSQTTLEQTTLEQE